jgi:hexokinase
MSGAMSIPPEDSLAWVATALTPSTRALQAMSERFRDEIARGLAGGGGSLKVLPTFIGQPRGDERGEVLYLDWGGTHGRAGRVLLSGDGSVDVADEEAVTFSEEQKTGPAGVVLDAIADAVARVAGHERTGRRRALGFVYSFPARLERIDRATALSLTKGWRVDGLVGRDVVELLARALARRGATEVAITAVANDTVAALALSTYRARGRDRHARPAEIGLIVGTGTNQAADLGHSGIRNLESGNFDGVTELETPYDVAIDREAGEPAPGAQRLEKMAAGQYLGEIVRRLVRDLARRTPWFRSWNAPALDARFGLDTASLSRIEADRSAACSDTERLLAGLGVTSSSEERVALRHLARVVVTRSARLIAAGLVGTLRHIDPDLGKPHRIAVDGSLYGGYPNYEGFVRQGLEELVGPERAGPLRLEFVRNSTALGAAVIAAVAGERPRSR